MIHTTRFLLVTYPILSLTKTKALFVWLVKKKEEDAFTYLSVSSVLFTLKVKL